MSSLVDGVFTVVLLVWCYYVYKTVNGLSDFVNDLRKDVDSLKKDIRSLNIWRDKMIDSKEES